MDSWNSKISKTALSENKRPHSQLDTDIFCSLATIVVAKKTRDYGREEGEDRKQNAVAVDAPPVLCNIPQCLGSGKTLGR